MPLPHVLLPPWQRRLAAAAVMLAALPLGALPRLPVAAAAATTTAPALQIVSTSSWLETGRVPALHVVGEVANIDQGQTAQDMLVDCKLTKGGVPVSGAEETMPTDAEVLKPGEKSPFDVLFVTPPARSTYDGQNCTVQSAPTIAQPDHNFTAQVLAVSPVDPTTGAQVITGSVTNNNTIDVPNAKLFFTLYRNNTDVPLQTIAEEWLWINSGNPVKAGVPTPFTLTRFGPTWDGVASALLPEAPTPAVSFSPTSVTMTQVRTTTGAAPPTTLTNVGTADLHLGTLTFGGAHPLEWSEVDTCANATIVPLGSCTIDLSFTPADVGDRSATLIVADDANQNPHTLTLTGTGIDPKAVPTPSPLSFHPRAVGTSGTQTLTVSNPGVGDLQVRRLSLTGPNAPDFAVVSDGCSGATVPAGSSFLTEM